MNSAWGIVFDVEAVRRGELSRAEIERELAAEELKQSIKRGLDEANPTADISAALRDAVHGPAKPPEPPATTDGQH